jgi:ketosteroid isomerase-like protein
MRLSLLLSLVLAVSVVVVRAQAAGQNEADQVEQTKKEVLKVEEELERALQSNDTDVLNRIYSDDYVYTNAHGEVLTKAQFLDDLRSGKHKISHVGRDDVHLHVHGNTVLLMGISTSTFLYKGKISNGPRIFTNVYVKEGGQWRLLSHQVTDIAKQ